MIQIGSPFDHYHRVTFPDGSRGRTDKDYLTGVRLGGLGGLGVAPAAAAAPAGATFMRSALLWMAGGTAAGAAGGAIEAMNAFEIEDTWGERSVFDDRLRMINTAFERLNENISECPEYWNTPMRTRFQDVWLTGWSPFYAEVGGGFGSFFDPSAAEVAQARAYVSAWAVYADDVARNLPQMCTSVQLYFPLGAAPPIDAAQGTIQDQFNALPPAVQQQAEQSLKDRESGVTKALRYGAWGLGALAVIYVAGLGYRIFTDVRRK